MTRADARAVYEAWRAAKESEADLPLEELLARHHELRAELEGLARRDELALAALGGRSMDAPQPELIGRSLGDFRFLRELGRGGMGIVFEAEQLSLGRRVAVKVLPAQLTLNPRAFQRFQREAAITARLKHPGIIDIHQMGEAGGVHFLAMELVEGTSLDRIIERMRTESFGARDARGEGVAFAVGLESADPGPAPRAKRGSSSAASKGHIETAVRLVCQVADALEHAHAAGVIHRDVKPSNILVRVSGQAVLTDFGLAREVGLPSITGTGEFAGTPSYVSPEQAMSGRVHVDHRTDVFSLGATLYELLTLQAPFQGHDAHQILAAILSKEPVQPSRLNPALAPDLVTIVLMALEKDPDRRYASAAALAEDLRAFIEYRPILAKRASSATRTLRWVRREPLKAALAVLLGVGTPLGAWLGYQLVSKERALIEEQTKSATAGLPDLLDHAFFALGLGRKDEAEERFRALIGSPEVGEEAVAGLTMVLLSSARPLEALQLLAEHEKAGTWTPALARLRVDAQALSGGADGSEADTVVLAPPSTALEHFLAAVRLLQACPYALEVGELSYLPLGAAGSPRPTTPSGKDIRLRHARAATEAIQHLGTAQIEDSGRALYHFAMAWATWVAHDERRAESEAEVLGRKWPDSAHARFFAGLALEVVELQRALDSYEKALALDPGLGAARERRAQIFVRTGDPRGTQEFETLVNAEPRRASYQAWLGAALLAENPPRTVQAANASGEAIDRDAGLLFAYRTRARAWYSLGDREKAAEVLRRAIEIEPEDVILRSDLGLVLDELGRWDEAEESLERALELDSSMPFPHYNLALLRQRHGEQELALRGFEQAIESAQERPEVGFPLDIAYGAAGVSYQQLAVEAQGPDASVRRREELEHAVESFRQAVALNPSPRHKLNLGVALFLTGNRVAAIEPLLEALNQPWAPEQRDLDDAYDCLVQALVEARRGAEALAVARDWCEAYPEDGRAWNQRAYIQADPEGNETERDVDDMLLSAERALELNGQADFGTLDTYALALHWAGDRDAALEAIEQALAGIPPGKREFTELLEAHAALIRGAE